MATVHRHSAGEGAAADEVLVHVLPIHIGSAYGVIHVIRPIDVATIHGHAKGGAAGVNEVLADVLRVGIGAADCVGSNVRPIDAAGRCRQTASLTQQKIICFLSVPCLSPHHDHGGRTKV